MTSYKADAGEGRRDDWETPAWLFEWCAAVWGPFDCDVAAAASNAKVRPYIDSAEDGLTTEWSRSNWCNPPFSLAAAFTERAAFWAERRRSSLLVLPAWTGTKWFHDHVFAGAAELVFLRGRVSLLRDGVPVPGNNADSVLAYYSRRSCLSSDMPMFHTVSTAMIKKGLLPYALRAPRQTSIMDRTS